MIGKYNKLVRDKIPEIISNQGEKPIIRTLDEVEYKKELEKKLLEEVREVIESDGDHRLEELADVLEVISSLANLLNSNIEEIRKRQKEKNDKHGEFNKRIYLEEVKANN